MTSIINPPGTRTMLVDVPANSTVNLTIPSSNRFFAVSAGLVTQTTGLEFVLATIGNGTVRLVTLHIADQLAVTSGGNTSLTLTNTSAYAASVLFFSFYGNLPTVVT